MFNAPTLGAKKRSKPTALNAQHQTKQGNGENPFSSQNKKAEYTLKTCETFFYAKSMKQKHRKTASCIQQPAPTQRMTPHIQKKGYSVIFIYPYKHKNRLTIN